MAKTRKIDVLTITSTNIVPMLSETPVNNTVALVSAGAPAIPNDEFVVNGKFITWDSTSAGYDLEVGDIVTADYEYEDGIDDTAIPYDPSSSTVNPTTISYQVTVIQEDTIPRLIHTPVPSTLTVKVNSTDTVNGIDWVLTGKTIVWVSLTTLYVGDIVYIEYKINQ